MIASSGRERLEPQGLDGASSVPAQTASVDGELGDFAHRVRQPLTAIVNYARGAILRSRRGTLTPEELERILEIVVTQAQRIAAELPTPEERVKGAS